MKRLLATLFILALVLICYHSALAHFQTLIPSTDIAGPENGGLIELDMVFTHPMENGPIMEMEQPIQFGCLSNGKVIDLASSLRSVKKFERSTYNAVFKPKFPADYVFFIEPAPYWEPAEQKMIIHYTKVVVDVYDAQTGWDDLVGLPVEIEPLVRPYGLWTGNIFRGLVRHNGLPVPFAEIEVEYLNKDKKVAIPSDAHITQIIKADSNGVFSYAMPKAGWWGFAALIDGNKKLNNPDGKPCDVELGGLIWIKTVDMK